MFIRSNTNGFFLFMILMTLVGCGAKTSTSDRRQSTSALLLPDSYACAQTPEGDRIKLDISQFQGQLSIVFTPTFSPLTMRAPYGIKNPLIVSDAIVTHQLQKLKDEFDQILKLNKESVENFGTIILTDETQVAEWQNFKARVERLKVSHDRWMDRRCALDQVANDEGWSVLLSKGYQMMLSDHMNKDDLMSEDILSLCQYFHPLPICKTEQSISRRNEGYLKVVSKYSQIIEKKKETSFFDRKDNLKWKCQMIGDKKVLTIPVRMNHPEVFKWKSSKEIILNNVSALWSQAGFEIKLVPEEIVESQSSDLSQTIYVTPTDQKISHVKNRQPRTMFINTQLSGDNLEKVMAHELGHILGFPDCYLEYYDRKLKQLVYLEVGETTDLMCSLQGKVRARSSALSELSQSCLTSD